MVKKLRKPIVFYDEPDLSNYQIRSSGYSPDIKNIIFGSYVKNDRLSDLAFQTFHGTELGSVRELNIFIDLYSVLHSIFSKNYSTNVSEQTAITTSIINMCAHYRQFFKGLSVKTRFYIIFSANVCDINVKFVPHYNEVFKHKFMIPMYQKLVVNNIELLNLICPYLPDIHFIYSKRQYESSVIMAYIIKTQKLSPNVILTRDTYPLSLSTMFPYTSILCPLKARGDHSIMIPFREHPMHREIFWSYVSKKLHISDKILNQISTYNYSLFSALFRFPDRYIFPLVTAKEAVNIINMVSNGMDMKISLPLLSSNPEIITRVPIALLDNRFKVLDIEYMLNYYEEDVECKEINYSNLSDTETINLINSKYFESNPINLAQLA